MLKVAHKRCIGDLSLVVDGFRCNGCDGTVQEADLAEDLLVDGETYGCEKRFCYLGYLAATARMRNGWMKFRECMCLC